jgi:subtilase family serine protease
MRAPVAPLRRRFALLGIGALMTLGPSVSAPATQAMAVQPLVSDVTLVFPGPLAPSEQDCFGINRRCFTPTSMRASYNLGPLYDQQLDGRGQTIAIVDSFGSATIRSDLNNFNTQMHLPHMCGETGVVCTASMPTFDTLSIQGTIPAVPPPPNNGTGQEAHNLWALEIGLDVEWAHSIAPGANILLVTTPTAETLGVQGFPQMMNAEQFVVDHHLASVISQSFGAAEESFASFQSLENLRGAFKSAQAAGITVLASSGDFGTANIKKEPVKNPATIPFPTVIWPASDPLVTSVGGTYLCTNPTATTFANATVDITDPPVDCHVPPQKGARNTNGEREVGWIAAGGGFSHVFGVPTFQTGALPAGSTAISGGRGVPDVGYQASSRTGVLVYETDELGGGGWFVVGGTSSGSPQWAALVAIADQKNNGPLGFINPALYKIGADPTRYKNDFIDVDTGNNGLQAPAIPGFAATKGWDAVTGLGTPNAANLVPDLVLAVHGQ